jgi:predicted transcriptional regulator of viral defense system
MKYIALVRKEFGSVGFPIFTMADVRLFLKSKGASYAYARLMLHNLLKKGEITRLTKGIYTFHHDVTVVGFAFRPFYYGLEDALMIRRLSLQGMNPLVLTTRNVRTGVRQFKGRNYVVYRIPKERFFGYSLVKYGDFWIPVSDVEKTVIDMLCMSGGIRDELWPGIMEVLDMKRLRLYLKNYKGKLREKVLKEVSAHKSHRRKSRKA